MTAELAERLSALCRARTHDSSARAEDVTPLPGHAGFSFRFALRSRGRCERLVLRLAPPRVRARGTADVARQARLMEGLGRHGVPVPPVRWYGDELQWFGRPYSVVELMPGSTLALEGERRAVSPESCRALVEQAIEALVHLHRLEPLPDASWLEAPLRPAEDVERWDRFVQRSADPELVALAPSLRRALLERAPPSFRTSMFHGDFQWTNLLFDDGRLVAVLDWELAAVGAGLNDLGWLCLFSDPASWAEDHPALPPVPGPREIEETYRGAWGKSLDGDWTWFHALAAYKFAAISGFNLMLHRRGKRPDPYWERLASSIPRLLERGLELLDVRCGRPQTPRASSLRKGAGPGYISNVE